VIRKNLNFKTISKSSSVLCRTDFQSVVKQTPALSVQGGLVKADPERYNPQYGGWCAYAMGDTGEKVSVDPETFKILDGKLYLFYHTFLSNTLNSWNEDEEHLKMEADKNWQKLIH